MQSPGGRFTLAASKASAFWRLARQAPPDPSNDEVVMGCLNKRSFRKTLEALLGDTVSVQSLKLQGAQKEDFTSFLIEPGNYAGDPKSIVIYCPSESGSSSSYREALSVIEQVIPLRIGVLCLSMTGAHSAILDEKTIGKVIEQLRGIAYEHIALWGRSAGAVGVLRCAARDPSVSCLICDGIYTDLISLLDAPKWVENPLASLRDLVSSPSDSFASDPVAAQQKKDTPIEVAACCHVPALFIHGSADDVVPPSHLDAFKKKYAGQRNSLLESGGTHDSERTDISKAKISLWLSRALRPSGTPRKRKNWRERERQEKHLMDMIASARAPSPPLSALDVKMQNLLGSRDASDRREGLLLATSAACPFYQTQNFEKVSIPSCTSADLPIEMTGTVILPQEDSEVEIVCAFDNGMHEDAVVQGGTVIVAVISTRFISLSLVQFEPARADAESEEPILGSEVLDKRFGGLRAIVRDLAMEQISTPCAERQIPIKIRLSGAQPQKGMHVTLILSDITSLEGYARGEFLQVLPHGGKLQCALQGGVSTCFATAGGTTTSPLLDLQVVENPGLDSSVSSYEKSGKPTGKGLNDDDLFWQLPVSNTLPSLSLASAKSDISNGGYPKTIMPSSKCIYEKPQHEKSTATGIGSLLTNGTLLTKSSIVSRRDGSLTLTNSECSITESRNRKPGSLSLSNSEASVADSEKTDAMFFTGSGSCSNHTWPLPVESNRISDRTTATLPAPGALM